MNKIKKLLLGALITVLSGAAIAENVRPNARPLRPEDTMVYGEVGSSAYRLNPSRTVHLVGVVGFNALTAAGSVAVMMSKSHEPITLVINSPGGSVQAGEILMQSMQMARSAGVRMDCVVIGASYSMGFNVLGACDRIYATPAASFLFHPVRAAVSEPMRALDALALAKELQKIDNKYLNIALSLTKLDKETVTKAYYAEKFWSRDEFIRRNAVWFSPIEVVYNLKPNALEYPEKEAFERMRREGTRRGEGKGLTVTLENCAQGSTAVMTLTYTLIATAWLCIIGVVLVVLRKVRK